MLVCWTRKHIPSSYVSFASIFYVFGVRQKRVFQQRGLAIAFFTSEWGRYLFGNSFSVSFSFSTMLLLLNSFDSYVSYSHFYVFCFFLRYFGGGVRSVFSTITATATLDDGWL